MQWDAKIMVARSAVSCRIELFLIFDTGCFLLHRLKLDGLWSFLRKDEVLYENECFHNYYYRVIFSKKRCIMHKCDSKICILGTGVT